MKPGAAVVVGVGNPYRRDDGIGPAVVAELARLEPAGVRLQTCDGDATQLLDAWADAELAIVVDAVRREAIPPGAIDRSDLAGGTVRARSGGSTHGLGILEAIRLAVALDRAPRRLIVYAVGAEDLGYGIGLSATTAGALPELIRRIVADVTFPGS